MIKHRISENDTVRLVFRFKGSVWSNFEVNMKNQYFGALLNMQEKYPGIVLVPEGDTDIGAYTGNYELRFANKEQKVQFLLTEM